MSLRVENLRGALAGPFSFTLDEGTCLTVTGPSGSGKTLLLRMLADLDPNDGDVTLDGVRRDAMTAPMWRRRVGLVPARCGWWDETVDAHFEGDARAERFALARELRLPEAIFTRRVDEASTGERQRLGLLRALLEQPRVLLLDEPTASLDPASVEAVEALLATRMAQGTSVVIVTHDERQAARIGRQHLRMRNGVALPA